MYNVASGRSTEGRRVLEIICRLLGREVPELRVNPSLLRPNGPESHHWFGRTTATGYGLGCNEKPRGGHRRFHRGIGRRRLDSMTAQLGISQDALIALANSLATASWPAARSDFRHRHSPVTAPDGSSGRQAVCRCRPVHRSVLVKCEGSRSTAVGLLALAIRTTRWFREGDDLRVGPSLSRLRDQRHPVTCRPRPAWYPPRGHSKRPISRHSRRRRLPPDPTSASPPGSWQSTHRRPRSWRRPSVIPRPQLVPDLDLTLVRDVGVLVRPALSECPNTATTGTSSPSKV
jgi:hypothetical protein